MRLSIWNRCAAAAACGGALAAGAQSPAPPAAAPLLPELPFVMLLMPPALMTSTNTLQSGCWTRVYDRSGYTGDSMTLAGPVALAQLRDVFGLRWRDRVRSIEVGPKATVTVYDNANFRDQVAQFKPGQRFPDLTKRMGFFDNFGSIQLTCAPP
ncbi:MAG: beta/gamma crystallin domain-containing protein [Pseudomonadota bacterium]